MRAMVAPDTGVKRPLEDDAPALAVDPKLHTYNCLLHIHPCLIDDLAADTVACSYCDKIMNRSYCINHKCTTLNAHLASQDHIDKVKQRAAAKNMDITKYFRPAPPPPKQPKTTVDL